MLVNKETIERFRTDFVGMAQKDSNRFDARDVEKIKENDWWIERFILVNKTEDAAFKALVKCMEWRKAFGINDLTETHFPEELYKIGLYAFHNNDKEGKPTLWVRFGSYHKSDMSPLIKQYLVYCIETLDRQNSHQGWALLCDSTGAGLSNVDMDLSNYMIEVLQNYYPRGPKYLAVIDLPWILNATAKVLMSFMNSELKSIVKFIKKDELQQYMDLEYIPVHLKGSYDKNMAVIPDGVKPLEELTHIKFSAEQIKKIRSAFKSELK